MRFIPGRVKQYLDHELKQKTNKLINKYILVLAVALRTTYLFYGKEALYWDVTLKRIDLQKNKA